MFTLTKHWVNILLFAALVPLYGQQSPDTLKHASQALFASNTGKEPWYDRISLRGYAQFRYNRLFETNPNLRCDQCDRSWGRNGGFFFRRIRLIYFGQVHSRVFMYIQPDFASEGRTIAQIRDAYFDITLDRKSDWRVRIGQSKVPFGFENLQSSQNRIPLDRNDGLNSAVANERDIGLFLYWTPRHVRDRFKMIQEANLKGSGDYGVLGFGLFNGQTANQSERNDQMHLVARATYPFLLDNGQLIEASIQGYTGEFVITTDLVANRAFRERRAALTLVYYAQPFGFQAEYNIGDGPEFDPKELTVVNRPLKGGFAQTMYYLRKGEHLIIPFVRVHTYEGGKKHELDATRHRVFEQEIGIEWQPSRFLELVAMYTFSDRTFENSLLPINRQRGRLLRLQAQVNF